MSDIPSVRLSAPGAAAGEIIRSHLIHVLMSSPARLVYIHAGAGYGKTTLLSQVAQRASKAAWLTLSEEEDVFSFVFALGQSIRYTFPEFDFSASEYMPFHEKKNFIAILAGLLACGMEKIPCDFLLVLDDLHSIESRDIKKLIECLIKYPPKNVRFCFGSREALPQEFVSFKIKGDLTELTQKELAFTREEVTDIVGFDEPALYDASEGWPLAIRFFRVLLENGIPIDHLSAYGRETLYTYLFRECIANLNPDMVDFLKASACFDELEAGMLDEVLGKKNTRLMLESLVARNMFTVKTSDGCYRYHALFKSSLSEMADRHRTALLWRGAARYYFQHRQYSRAARYAIAAKDFELLESIILTCYREYIKTGHYSELGGWFRALPEKAVKASPPMLVAKGAYLSFVGNFVGAKACLAAAIPLMNEHDRPLYVEAMIHQARVLRNFDSFEASNRLLDELMEKLGDSADESVYSVGIEKLYNLCWIPLIHEAETLARQMIGRCANAGNLKVKRWFERYLCAVCFFKGNMKESVQYYEKSFEIPEEEQSFLGVHSTAIYVAKAYQLLGERSRSLSVLSAELSRLRNTGNYEELWAGYLLAAEIHYQNALTDRMNGQNASYETAIKYFALADEYAPLYRKTRFQMHWATMQHLTYSLMFTSDPKEDMVREIMDNLDGAGDYLKSIVFARLMGYYGAVSDYPNAVWCARQCIETGESAGLMLHASLAYGVLARAAIAAKEQEKATMLTARYLRLCREYGLYEYFKMRKAYDPILEWAYEHGIEPEFTAQMMAFVGYRPRKVYVETLGAFTVYQDRERKSMVKFRTKKERELLAFLLDVGEQGATKEQIHNAIWWDSESGNIKNLISVNLQHLKNDLKAAGIEASVVCRGNRYFLCREKIECDAELFEKAYEAFKLHKTRETAKELLSLYRGEYLSDFEALWATVKRIRYHEVYDELNTFEF